MVITKEFVKGYEKNVKLIGFYVKPVILLTLFYFYYSTTLVF